MKKNLSSSILLLRRTLIFKTAFCYEIFQYIVKLKAFCSKHPSAHYLESVLRILLCSFYHIVFHRCVLCALWTLFCLHGPLGHGDSPQTPQGPGKVGVSCQLVTETTGVGRLVYPAPSWMSSEGEFLPAASQKRAFAEMMHQLHNIKYKNKETEYKKDRICRSR